MNDNEIAAHLAKPLNAIIGTHRQAGGPQLTPVWFYWDGEAFYFSTTTDRKKFANIQRNPAISVMVDDLAAHEYVVAYGNAEIIQENVPELTRPILEKYMPGQASTLGQEPNRIIIKLRPATLLSR